MLGDCGDLAIFKVTRASGAGGSDYIIRKKTGPNPSLAPTSGLIVSVSRVSVYPRVKWKTARLGLASGSKATPGKSPGSFEGECRGLCFNSDCSPPAFGSLVPGTVLHVRFRNTLDCSRAVWQRAENLRMARREAHRKVVCGRALCTGGRGGGNLGRGLRWR